MKPLWVRLKPEDLVQAGDIWTRMTATDMNAINYDSYETIYREFVFMGSAHFGRNAGNWSENVWRFAGIAPEVPLAEPNNTERKIEMEL